MELQRTSRTCGHDRAACTNSRTFTRCRVATSKKHLQEAGRDADPSVSSHHGTEAWASSREKHSKQRCRHYHLQQTARAAYIEPRTPSRSSFSLLSFALLLLVLTLTGTAAALEQPHAHRRTNRRLVAYLDDSVLEPDWKRSPVLNVDNRPSPLPPLMHLQRREDAASSTASPQTSNTINTDPKATATNSPIPRPFDTALGTNFTTSCTTFFRSFLSNTTFTECHPLSLLLQTSSGFFDAAKSFVRITNTLEATCKVDQTKCVNVMSGFAVQLKDNANCGLDYTNDNPTVLQAYNGLVAYQPLYQAGCLTDTKGSYCFANAITNTSSSTDSYPYYIPLGMTMPGGARPSCTKCLQDAMAIFSSFAGNKSQPVSRTYNSAAQQIDVSCGPTFVNRTATPLKADAPGHSLSLTPTITLFIMFFLYFWN